MHSNFKDFSILYVEDDEGIRNVNFSMFQRIFKEAYEASDGEEGYQLYLEHKPDIIVTDIKMPRMDGIELAKKIRKNDEETKIIITTAFNDEKYLLQAIELNLERYLVKPLTKRNLFPALEKAISHIQKRVILSKGFYFDLKSSLFYFENSIIKMTKKELLFLSLLVKNRDKIITYEEIEEEVWEHECMSIRSLRTTIGILRKKIPFNIISNISNMGYKLKLDPCIQ
jgi:DNA-binding response OmpR family regulator